jgi:hypothetical protein
MMTKLVFVIFIFLLTSCWGETSTVVTASNDSYPSHEIKESNVENRIYFCEYCGKKQYLKSWNETITKGEWIDKKTK